LFSIKQAILEGVCELRRDEHPYMALKDLSCHSPEPISQEEKAPKLWVNQISTSI